jgi:hypothetical protein
MRWLRNWARISNFPRARRIKKLRLVDNAIDGDTQAAKEIFDRIDGKVTQIQSHQNNGDEPLKIDVIERAIVDPQARNV